MNLALYKIVGEAFDDHGAYELNKLVLSSSLEGAITSFSARWPNYTVTTALYHTTVDHAHRESLVEMLQC